MAKKIEAALQKYADKRVAKGKTATKAPVAKKPRTAAQKQSDTGRMTATKAPVKVVKEKTVKQQHPVEETDMLDDMFFGDDEISTLDHCFDEGTDDDDECGIEEYHNQEGERA